MQRAYVHCVDVVFPQLTVIVRSEVCADVAEPADDENAEEPAMTKMLQNLPAMTEMPSIRTEMSRTRI